MVQIKDFSMVVVTWPIADPLKIRLLLCVLATNIGVI